MFRYSIVVHAFRIIGNGFYKVYLLHTDFSNMDGGPTNDVDDAQPPPPPVEVPPQPLTFNPITQDVIEATIQCLVAQAQECVDKNMDKLATEQTILEEFGRCFDEIFEFSYKTNKLWKQNKIVQIRLYSVAQTHTAIVVNNFCCTYKLNLKKSVNMMQL